MIDGKPHKNVVIVWRTGKLPDLPFHYIDMELCKFSLDDYIISPETYVLQVSDGFAKKDFQNRCLDILTQVTEGLAFLHSQDVTHSDLKPSNGLSLFMTNNN